MKYKTFVKTSESSFCLNGVMHYIRQIPDKKGSRGINPNKFVVYNGIENMIYAEVPGAKIIFIDKAGMQVLDRNECPVCDKDVSVSVQHLNRMRDSTLEQAIASFIKEVCRENLEQYLKYKKCID